MLDPASLQTCRRLMVTVVLMTLWAKALSPQGVFVGVALIASGCALVAAAVAALLREPLLGPSLNRWDEAAAFTGMHCLARLLA